ncbi:MAG TPA: prolipoprotein diacylglyceryl transferase family protein [Candidatus Acidoferrales bacterium]|nr:prolipoprotein diacylglyceryl transferase family protein [Candidatus Acidoferrales bacterium]
MPVYFQMWILAAALGIGEGVRLLRQAGLNTKRALLGMTSVAVIVLIGSKLLFSLEHVLLPYDAPVLMPQGTTAELARHGFRIPGGIALMGILAPLVCRALRLPTARFVDAVMPAIGLGIVFIRIGCFLQGCCFGARTDGPFGLAFPRGALVYEYQLLDHQIGWNATAALPVYPLQLCFAGLGFLMYVLGRYWQRNKEFDGEVWAKEFLLFFGGTFLLEFVRAVTLRLNLILTATVFVIAAVSVVRARQATRVLQPLRS